MHTVVQVYHIFLQIPFLFDPVVILLTKMISFQSQLFHWQGIRHPTCFYLFLLFFKFRGSQNQQEMEIMEGKTLMGKGDTDTSSGILSTLLFVLF